MGWFCPRVAGDGAPCSATLVARCLVCLPRLQNRLDLRYLVCRDRLKLAERALHAHAPVAAPMPGPAMVPGPVEPVSDVEAIHIAHAHAAKRPHYENVPEAKVRATRTQRIDPLLVTPAFEQNALVVQHSEVAIVHVGQATFGFPEFCRVERLAQDRFDVRLYRQSSALGFG